MAPRLPVVGTINWLWFFIGAAFAMFLWPWLRAKVM